MPFAKLSRVLLNAAFVRGRKRMTRLVVLLFLTGLLLIGLRQAYTELSQQKQVQGSDTLYGWKKSSVKNAPAQVGGELMKKVK